MNHVTQHPSVVAGDRVNPGFEPGDPDIRTNTVYVLYTSVEETLAAVRVAARFARPMGTPITLVHLRTVPFALPVDAPVGRSPVEMVEFAESLQREGVDVHLRVHLCRAERLAIPLAFKSHSLIVMAGRHHWWSSKAERRRRALEAAGHFVVFVDTAEREACGPHGKTTSATEEKSHA